MRARTLYALYRGDNFIAIGTIEELAKMQGIKPQSLRFKATPAYRKRQFRPEENYILIKVGRSDDYECNGKKAVKENS